MTTTLQLAERFLVRLTEELGETTYREACVRNAQEPTPGICHSHDFCDANMVMLAAFQDVGLDVPDADSDDQTLWNASWEMAFLAMVQIGRGRDREGR